MSGVCQDGVCQRSCDDSCTPGESKCTPTGLTDLRTRRQPMWLMGRTGRRARQASSACQVVCDVNPSNASTNVMRRERVAAPGNPPIPPVTPSEGVCDGLTHNHAYPVRRVPVVGAVRPARTAASKATPSASMRVVFRCAGDRRMDASTMAPHNHARAARCSFQANRL